MSSAVFLDKDGTLIKNVPYNTDPSLISLETQTVEGLLKLYLRQFKLIVVTNQPGIAHGFFYERELILVKRTIEQILKPYGIPLHGFYYCPHHPDGILPAYATSCTCRKPLPGLLEQAARHHDIDLKASWMIGDILDDVEAGNRAGCQTILIDNGNETEWITGHYRTPHKMVASVNDAADYIIEQQLNHYKHP